MVKSKTICFLLIEIMAFALMVLFNADILVSLILLLWLWIVWYAFEDINNRIFLFMFSFSFFNFLLGREILEHIFKYQIEDFPPNVEEHAKITLLVSLIVFFISYLIFSKKNFRRDSSEYITTQHSVSNIMRIRSISLYLYYFAIVIAIIYNIVIGYFTLAFGYYGSYTDVALSTIYNNTFVFAIEKVNQMMPVFLALFFATVPSYSQTKRVTTLYFIYLMTSLLSGRRATFVIGLLWIIIYYVYRNSTSEEKWINKQFVVVGVLMLPVALLLLSLLSQIREGNGIDSIEIVMGIPNYFYQQGVSVNVIKRSYEFASRLNSNHLYSMSVFTDGILGRIFGFTRYAGNSAIHAQEGYSLAHALSYAILGDGYLLGRGTGSSYIAELYHDFKIWGVVIGNIIYGFVVSRSLTINANKVYLNAMALLIIRQMLWSPRGGFTDFLLVLLQPFTILAFLMVVVLSQLLKSKYGYRKINNG